MVSGAAGKVAKAIPAVQKPTVHASEPCCSVVANAALKGRMGRLVLAFPEGASAASTRVRIGAASADGSVSDKYGSQTLDLMPGNYTVEISGATLKNVAVKSGHDTRVRVGALRLSASSSTRIQTYEPANGKLLTDKNGAQVIGFPVGSVNVKIAGQMQTVKIEDNKVVDF